MRSLPWAMLTDEERSTIRKQIEEKIRELSLMLEESESREISITPDVSIGRLSRMDAIQQKAVQSALLSETATKLKKLKDILHRLNDREYGLCRQCGQAIPVARLLYIPDSELCVNCARKD